MPSPSSSDLHYHRPNNANHHHNNNMNNQDRSSDRSDRSSLGGDRSSLGERSIQERPIPPERSSRNSGGRSSNGGDNTSSRSSSRQRLGSHSNSGRESGRESVLRSDMEEDDIMSGAENRRRVALGRTSNHLSLSTSSTLSTTSNGSQAKLIHASNTALNYQNKSNSRPGT